MSSQAELNKQLVMRFFAAIESGDFTVFDEIVAKDYDDHLPGQSRGRDLLRTYFLGLRQAFPDVRFPVHAMVAEGDRVAVMNSINGTHSGDYTALGLKATGNRIDAMAFQLYRIEAGQLAEHWEVADFATIMRQLKG